VFIRAIRCFLPSIFFCFHPSLFIACNYGSSLAPSVNLSVRPWKWRLSVDTFSLLIYAVDLTCTEHRQLR
jgi:hypothetical protein